VRAALLAIIAGLVCCREGYRREVELSHRGTPSAPRLLSLVRTDIAEFRSVEHITRADRQHLASLLNSLPKNRKNK